MLRQLSAVDVDGTWIRGVADSGELPLFPCGDAMAGVAGVLLGRLGRLIDKWKRTGMESSQSQDASPAFSARWRAAFRLPLSLACLLLVNRKGSEQGLDSPGPCIVFD